MNTVECYIHEIHSVQPANRPAWDYQNREWVTADWTYNCWGNKTRTNELLEKQHWEQIQKDGYDMR